MSGRTFEMIESEDEGSTTDGDDNDQDLPNEDGSDANETEPKPEHPVKKKRAVGTRVFTEFDRWDRSDCTDEDRLVFIRRYLDQCNTDAGIQHVPGKHKIGKMYTATLAKMVFEQKFGEQYDSFVSASRSMQLSMSGQNC